MATPYGRCCAVHSRSRSGIRKNNVLTLARDQIGLNVVMWHRNERFFAFATMPNGLFAMDDVPRELSEEKFADFLVLNHAEHATTIYKNIFRVRPAHVMQVDARGAITQQQYWSPHDVKPVRLRSDQDYADGLRECLDVAVRRQMRSAHPIGCLLSGGLDSSSVAVLAARALNEKNQRLAAFTGVPRRGFDGPVAAGHYADETPYVDAIARMAGTIDVTYVAERCRPTISPNSTASSSRWKGRCEIRPISAGCWRSCGSRATQGRRVLLGGLHGNSTISWSGWSQAADHLRRGRWLTALRQWNLYYRRTPHSRWTATRNLFIEPLMPAWLGDWTDVAVTPTRMRHGRSTRRSDPNMQPRWVSKRARGANRHDFHYRARPDERIQGLLQADYAGDWRAAEKALTGVEVRDPTADIDVVSYCFGVPPEQYLAEGTDRSLIRRAMWGLLPEAVLTNRLRGLQDADWHERFAGRRSELAQRDRSAVAVAAGAPRDRSGSPRADGVELADRRLASSRNIHRIQSRADARGGWRPFPALVRVGELIRNALRCRLSA